MKFRKWNLWDRDRAWKCGRREDNTQSAETAFRPSSSTVGLELTVHPRYLGTPNMHYIFPPPKTLIFRQYFFMSQKNLFLDSVIYWNIVNCFI